MRLPKYVAFKSKLNHKFLRYVNQPGTNHHGLLQCSEDEPSQFTKFEIEKAFIRRNQGDQESEEEWVHVKCCYNNRYWILRPEEDGAWIQCGASRKEADKWKENCTLFRVVYMDQSNPVTVRIQDPMMVGEKHFVRVLQRNDYAFRNMQYCDDDSNPMLADGIASCALSRGLRFSALFTVVDWESLFPEKESFRHDHHEKGQSSGDGGGGDDQPFRVAEPNPPPTTVLKEQRYEHTFLMVSSANDFWGSLFASTELLPKAHENVYASIHVDKGNGFTEHSVRRIDFAHGTYPQWKNWEEQIMRVDHEKKTMILSAVSGGPLNQCGIFKTTVEVSARMRSPKRHGCFVKWTCCYTELKGSFHVKNMANLVESSFNKLDENLLREADRASGY